MARLAPLAKTLSRHPAVARAIHLTRASLERLVELQFVERSIALGSLAFTAIIPLLVIAAALLPGTDGIANDLVKRFHLTGSTAEQVRQVFAQPDSVRQSLSWLGLALLIGSALSFTRALQRVFEHAWRLETRGLAGTRAGLTWLGGVVLWATVFSAVREWLLSITGPVGSLTILLAGDAALWLWSPWILLARRVDWRRLVPSALLTAVAMTGLSIGSVVYMPEAISSSAEHYGSIGIAIALVSYLVGAGFALTICAAVGAVLGGEVDDPPAATAPDARDPRA